MCTLLPLWIIAEWHHIVRKQICWIFPGFNEFSLPHDLPDTEIILSSDKRGLPIEAGAALHFYDTCVLKRYSLSCANPKLEPPITISINNTNSNDAFHVAQLDCIWSNDITYCKDKSSTPIDDLAVSCFKKGFPLHVITQAPKWAW